LKFEIVKVELRDRVAGIYQMLLPVLVDADGSHRPGEDLEKHIHPIL